LLLTWAKICAPVTSVPGFVRFLNAEASEWKDSKALKQKSFSLDNKIILGMVLCIIDSSDFDMQSKLL